MSFKLPSIASFFSRLSHKDEDDKKNSESQFVTVTSHKTEKTDSKDSGSKILRFFQRLFHSKEKARVGVDSAFQKNNGPNPCSLHVQKQTKKSGLFDIDHIASITGAPKYFVMLDQTTSVASNPAGAHNVLDQRHQFIDSSEGRFMIDIANMGSRVDKPHNHFRAPPGLDLQKTLTEAFQIYYEEGKRDHVDSFATTHWECPKTAQSSEDLNSLRSKLKQIAVKSIDDQALLKKADRAIECRIHRIVSGQH